MPKVEIIFDVEGTGDFPSDMLRYDNCKPFTDGAADVMNLATVRRGGTATADEFYGQARKVTLIGPDVPTFGRWTSFGWTVTYVQRYDEYGNAIPA